MIEWWIWVLIGIATGIYAENVRRQGRRAIPWTVRYWFSEHWPAIVVLTPIVLGGAGCIGVVTGILFELKMMADMSFIVLACVMPFLVWMMWMIRKANKAEKHERTLEAKQN